MPISNRRIRSCSLFPRAGLLAGVLALAALAPVSIANAQNATQAPSNQPAASELALARGLSRVFQSVAKRLEPCVVNITQFSNQLVRTSMWDAPEQRMLQTGLGSGVIISRDGLVLTNHHVVKGADKLTVRFSDGRELTAKVIGSDDLTDVAVIKVEGDDFPYAEFDDSDKLEVGEWVVAIGSPFGFSSTVTSGIVSAKGRTNVSLPTGDDSYQDFIQTDAAINPGNSGGPLLNLDGKIVGINSAIATRTGGYEGIGFAIPSNMARTVMDTIVKHGKVVRGFLGMDATDLPFDELHKLGLRSGVRVTNVSSKGPAAEAGLKVGDIITAYQDRPTDNFKRLRAAIALTPPGAHAKLDVVRDGKAKTIQAELADKDELMSQLYGMTSVEALGLVVATLQPEQASDPDLKGVVVQSAPARGQLQPGDLIVAVGDESVASGPEFKELISKANIRRGVKLNVIRGNMQGYITVRG